MGSLNLKVPPALQLALAIFAGWGLALLAPGLTVDLPLALPLAVILLLLGVAVATAGVLAFRRHRTTVNPLAPQRSSAMVDDGVYRYSRNPMYLGMLLCLLAYLVYQSNLLALVVLPLCFVLAMTHWQIVPEETVLRAKFGADYEDYLRRVRRWL